MTDFQEAILVVDDEPKVVHSLAAALQEIAPVIGVTDAVEALEAVKDQEVGLAIVDQRMPDMLGTEVLTAIREQSPHTIRFLLTGYSDLRAMVSAINDAHIHLYIEKPWDLEQLSRQVRAGLEAYRQAVRQADELAHEQARSANLEAENIGLRSQVQSLGLEDEIQTVCPEMERALAVVNSAARASDLVLVCGESGTGKELVARRIHRIRHGDRAPFVAVNCGALTDGLIDSELFGHEQGAFTGAERGFPGAFEQANGGTVFLDEIGELRLDLQMTLTRVLEESVVRRLGGPREIPFKASIIASTHRNLEAMVAGGRFREVLYYRLNVVRVNLPPLRERRQDIPLLLEHFVKQVRRTHGRPGFRFAEDAVKILGDHSFPGNVRELKNLVIRAATSVKEDEVGPAHLAELIGHLEDVQTEYATADPAALPSSDAEIPDMPVPADTEEFDVACEHAVIEVERRFLEHWLRACRGNFTEISRRTGIHVKRLYNMAKRMGYKKFDD